MAAHLFWFYDALVIGILLICIYIGGKRGFLRSAVYVTLVILSIVVSFIGSEIAAPLIYDNLIKEQVVEGLSQSSNNTELETITFEAINEGDYGVEVTDTEVSGILSAAGDLFENIANEIKKSGAIDDADEIKTEVEESVAEKMLTSLLGEYISDDSLTEMLVSIEGTADGVTNVLDVFIKGDKSETARVTEEQLVAPVIKGLIKILTWLLLMFLFSLFIKPISDSMKMFNKVPLLGPVNSFLGAILGIVQGIIASYAVALAVKLAVYLTEGTLMFINNETISQTYIFKSFYYLDISTLI